VFYQEPEDLDTQPQLHQTRRNQCTPDFLRSYACANKLAHLTSYSTRTFTTCLNLTIYFNYAATSAATAPDAASSFSDTRRKADCSAR
jgi:hypothetical protein